MDIHKKGTFFSTDINQILKLNGTTHEYASIVKHPDIGSNVTRKSQVMSESHSLILLDLVIRNKFESPFSLF